MTPAAVSECVVYDWAERLERNWFRGAYSAGEHTDAPKLPGSFAYCTLRPVGTATASRAGHFCRMRTVAGGTQRCVLDGLQRNANHSQITPRAQASAKRPGHYLTCSSRSARGAIANTNACKRTTLQQPLIRSSLDRGAVSV